MMVRVILPFHLRTLAHVGSEVTLEVEGTITQRSVLDALEARYPMLRGAYQDNKRHTNQQRRPFPRLSACVVPFSCACFRHRAGRASSPEESPEFHVGRAAAAPRI